MAECTIFRMTNEQHDAYFAETARFNAAAKRDDTPTTDLLAMQSKIVKMQSEWTLCVRDHGHEMPHRAADGTEWYDIDPADLEP